MGTLQEIIACLEVVFYWSVMFTLAVGGTLVFLKVLVYFFEKEILSILRFITKEM